MKNPICLLIVALALSTAAYAANPTEQEHLFCDFESPGALPALRFHSPSGGGDVSIVEDPDNSSNHVLKIVSPAGDNWGGAIFNEVSAGETYMNDLYSISNNRVTGYDVVTMMMYRVDNTHVPQLKTVDVDDDGHTTTDYLDIVPTTVGFDRNYASTGTIRTGEWQLVEFTVTHCHNSGINFIYIMPDRQGSSTVYIDDIKFYRDHEKPIMGTVSCGTSTDGTISLLVTATDNVSDPVNHYLVSLDGTQASATEYTASGGVLTVTGLAPETSYHFTVWAKDYAGYVSDNSAECTCSTEAAPAGNTCRQALTSTTGNKTIYISCEKAGNYRLTIECDEAMTGLGGSFCHINGTETYQLNLAGRYLLSADGKTITCDIASTTDPSFYTPLYVLIDGEKQFAFPTGVVWGTCAPAVPCTAPPSGGTIQWPNLQYSRGATPYDLEFTAPVTGEDVHYQWYISTNGSINEGVDQPYTGPGAQTEHCTPATDVIGLLYYYCKIWNDCGYIYSTVASVDIVECMLSGVNISGPTAVTEGTSLVLTMTYPASNGGYKTACWYHNGTLIECQDSIHAESVLIINPCTLEDAGSYYCTLQDGVNCTVQTASKGVTVNPGAPPTVIDHTAIELCLGESITLTGGTQGPWSWTTGATTQSITVTPTAVGTLLITCTTAKQIDNYTIRVKDCTPPPTVIDHPAMEICLGESITLTGGAEGPWSWTNGATTQSITVEPTAVGTLTFTCTTAKQIDNFTIRVKDCTPEPCQELIYSKWDDVLFVNNGDSIFVAYQWFCDGQPMAGETGQYYYAGGSSLAGSSHQYHAIAYRADGSFVVACAKTFGDFTRSASVNPGESRQVSVYPNPARRNMPVRVEGAAADALITLYTVAGQRLAVFAEPEFTLSLPAGCYLISTTAADGSPYCQTLIVQ